MTKIRFFGSSECKQCANLHIILQKYEVEYEYVDAYADDTQELCDKYDVDELPHLQFINIQGDVVYKLIGEISEKTFLKNYAILY